jgi:hypothetical protein
MLMLILAALLLPLSAQADTLRFTSGPTTRTLHSKPIGASDAVSVDVFIDGKPPVATVTDMTVHFRARDTMIDVTAHKQRAPLTIRAVSFATHRVVVKITVTSLQRTRG